MPTDLPPDYKPQPAKDPNNPADPSVPGSVPAYPPKPGEDARDPGAGGKRGPDVVDPSGVDGPPEPGGDAVGIPAPAGTPSF